MLLVKVNNFDALYNRFIEDVSKTMSGRVLSMSQIPFYFLQAERKS